MEELESRAKVAITIITASYNRAGMIASAIESVLAQDAVPLEHIVVDGGSTDGTLEILKRYAHLKVIRGPDTGMYHALNKGLDATTGEIIGFLNSDDIFAENIFSAIVREFRDPNIMAVTGHAVVFSELPGGPVKIVDQYAPGEKSLIEDLTTRGAFFNAWFFRRSTFDQIGKFNTGYRIAGDREFMLRFALHNLKYAVISNLVYKYRMHEDSLTFDKTGEKRARSADEHLMMTRFYLTKQSLPHLERKLLIRLRTLETVDMAARSIWTWKPKKFLHYFIEGLKYNPAWPIKFFLYIVRRSTVMILAR